MFKIIKKCNFDKESISDILIEENLTSQQAQLLMENKYEKYNSERACYFYTIVNQDYKLYNAYENLP